MTDGLSYYDSGPGMRSGIRVIGVVYVIVGNGAVSSNRAMRFTDEQYIYTVMFEKVFNFINMLMKSVGVPLGHPQEFSQFYFLLSSIVSMFITMLFCCNN
jgi:siroheme synthase (precorrin-2 oxidase/ferrochelatase)